jgi:hypothetical protein
MVIGNGGTRPDLGKLTQKATNPAHSTGETIRLERNVAAKRAAM